MVHIFIANKESVRFPGKNAVLLPYTVAWLARAVPLLNEPCRVYCAGEPLPGIPDSWRYIPAPTKLGHLAVLRAAEKAAAPGKEDVCVLVQLTQPLREAALLSRAVALCRKTAQTVISATEMPEAAWRRLDARGTWAGQKKHCRIPYLDGRIYAWLPGRVHEIFDCACPHAVVHTVLPFIVDVDMPADWPAELGSMLVKPLSIPDSGE